MKKFLSFFLVFILGFIVCAWTIFRIYGKPQGMPGANIITVSGAPAGAPATVSDSQNPVRAAAAVISDYVVNIDTVGRPVVAFDFFGGAERRVPKGQGSGVVFSPDGYILTNNHVAAGAEQMKVTMHDGKTYPARLIGRDPATDVAVIKIDAKTPKFATFANSDQVKVGDWVVAVGSPLGYESTVTVGVVSAMRRGPFNINGQSLQLEKLVQTDAAINPGNSGGALADLQGRVVGINTLIASTSGGSIGIGFAVPSNTAKVVAEKLIKSGKVDHPYLGIIYQPFNEDRRKALEAGGVSGLPKQEGAEIRAVRPGSPAEQAGLQPGDIVLKVNGKSVSISKQPEKGETSISEEVGRTAIGKTLRLQIWRASDGRTSDVKVRVGKMPEDFGQAPQE